METTKIIRLEVEDYKRIRAVEIVPDGNAIVIGGRNAQGKSSVLDAIFAALGGKKAIAAKPVREGAGKSTITLTLDNGTVITRTIRPDGEGTIKVERDGATYKSPQAMLDALVGPLSFDPVAFTRLDSKRQLAELQALAGLDFTATDAQRATLYEERTQVGREGKRLAGAVESMPQHDDAPAEEVSVAALAEEMRAAEQAQREHDEAAREADIARRDVKQCSARVEAIQAEIKRLQAEASDVEKRQAQRSKDAAQYTAKAAACVIPDVAVIRERLAGADDANRKARANRDRATRVTELESERARYAALSERIDALDEAKRAAIAGAQYPLEGLSVGDGGILYRGVPFSQASGAESLRVSVAIGLAMNPKLRVILVREGALLDDESLAAVKDEAEKRGAQIWLEVVGKRQGVSIVIEDGGVLGAVSEAAE